MAYLTSNPLCIRIRDCRSSTHWATAVSRPGVDATALRGGGADLGVSLGRTVVRFRLSRTEALALAQWLTENAARKDDQ